MTKSALYLAVSGVALLASASVLAQSNSSTVNQNGSDSTVTVDQSVGSNNTSEVDQTLGSQFNDTQVTQNGTDAFSSVTQSGTGGMITVTQN